MTPVLIMSLCVLFSGSHKGGSYVFGHFAYGLHAGAVEVVVVLARLDELMLLDVSLHLLSRHHEMVVAPIHFVVPLRPCRV